MKIGLDIDGVCCKFSEGFIKIAHSMGYGYVFPKSAADVMHWTMSPHFGTVWKEVKLREEFWLGLEAFEVLPFDFEVAAYVTSRPINNDVTKLWLEKNGFPNYQNVYTVAEPEDKLPIIKGLGLDVFVDDKIETVEMLQNNGINAILYYAPYQRGHTHSLLPIYSLKELNATIKERSFNR